MERRGVGAHELVFACLCCVNLAVVDDNIVLCFACNAQLRIGARYSPNKTVYSRLQFGHCNGFGGFVAIKLDTGVDGRPLALGLGGGGGQRAGGEGGFVEVGFGTECVVGLVVAYLLIRTCRRIHREVPKAHRLFGGTNAVRNRGGVGRAPRYKVLAVGGLVENDCGDVRRRVGEGAVARGEHPLALGGRGVVGGQGDGVVKILLAAHVAGAHRGVLLLVDVIDGELRSLGGAVVGGGALPCEHRLAALQLGDFGVGCGDAVIAVEGSAVVVVAPCASGAGGDGPKDFSRAVGGAGVAASDGDVVFGD